MSPKEKTKAGILKPVKAPSGGARHHNNMSGQEFIDHMATPQKVGSNMSYQLSPKSNQLNGYMSQGQVSDANSARLSNVQTFKYNPVNMIRKVSP
jgi:hypothetical protein